MNIIKKNTIIKLTTAISLINITTSIMASTVSPYDYSVFKNAINDTKWQRGSNSVNAMYFSTSGTFQQVVGNLLCFTPNTSEYNL